MEFSTVESIPVVLLGRERHLRLSLMAPAWYKSITHKPLLDLIVILQHQLQAGVRARTANERKADDLGIPIEQLPPEETVDPDSTLDAKDRIDIVDMIPDVVAAIYALAHWEDIANRPQGAKEIPLPGELTTENFSFQLDLDAYPMLLLLIMQVWYKHAMKAGPDTKEDASDDPNAKSPTPQNFGESGESPLDSVPTSS